MRYSIFTILLLCLTTSYSIAQTHLDIRIPDSINHDLVGHVKVVKETSETENLFGEHKKTKEVDERSYDLQGNRLVRTETDQNGNMTRKIESIYDEQGCYVKEIAEDHEKQTRDEFEISINVRKRVISKKNTRTGELKATLYTPKGYEHKIKEVDADGNVTETTEIKRLANNKEGKLSDFDGRGRKTRTIRLEWTRDVAWKKMMIEDYLKDSKLTIEYEYIKKDSRGNWTKRIENSTLIKDGKRTPLTKTIVTREFEYH